MKIPKYFSIAGKRITVHLKRTIGRKLMGRMWFQMNAMEIATHAKKVPRPVAGPHGVTHTFWHESIHAILYAMGHPLYKDEAFVDALSLMITQLIETSEFEDDQT